MCVSEDKSSYTPRFPLPKLSMYHSLQATSYLLQKPVFPNNNENKLHHFFKVDREGFFMFVFSDHSQSLVEDCVVLITLLFLLYCTFFCAVCNEIYH